VIIVEAISQDSAQVVFTDDDRMIETLSVNRVDYAFRVWILEGDRGAVIYGLENCPFRFPFLSEVELKFPRNVVM
jgi:hypothetical protein